MGDAASPPAQQQAPPPKEKTMTKKKNAATIWIAKFTTQSDDDDDEELRRKTRNMNWNERRAHSSQRICDRIMTSYPKIIQEAQHGDLIEDSRISGYRSDGIYMISRRRRKTIKEEEEETKSETKKEEDTSNLKSNNDDHFEVLPLDFSIEDHGSVPFVFEALTEFPLDYWEYDNMSVVAFKDDDDDGSRSISIDPTITKATSYWHTDCSLVKCGDIREEATNIRSENNKYKKLIFEYRGKEYTINYVDTLDMFYGEYNGLVYVQGPTSGSVEL